MSVRSEAAAAESELPPPGTCERWAHDYIAGDVLADKFSPPPLPSEWAAPAVQAGPPRAPRAPGRPPELALAMRGERTPGAGAMRDPRRRARLLHTFLHHELQAAELMCRAVLAFPDTPLAFRRGLLGICLDEVRHMNMYAEHIEALGHRVGDFPVNDWFWQRVPAADTAARFVAIMGLGFEGANLDHTQRFAARFRRAGDVPGAALQERVGEEEVPHVAFGAHWFQRFAGGLDFARWTASLPPPLSPMLMRGRPLARQARVRAGYSTAFLEELERWQPTPPGT